MSLTFGQAASLLCVATMAGVILYEPIIKPVYDAIKEFNQNSAVNHDAPKPAPPQKKSSSPPHLKLLK